MSAMIYKAFFLWAILGAPASEEAPSPERQRPGVSRQERKISPKDYLDPNGSESDYVSVPDRWSQFYDGRWYDPYNTNILKGDLPIFGSQAHPWFLELGVASDSLVEYRDLPIPVGAASTRRADSNNTFGDGRQLIFSENLAFLFSLYQGNTTFKPQTFEFRAAPVFNVNHVRINENGILRVDTTKGHTRTDHHLGFQELFAEIHLADVSDRYDFISTRLGIQRFNSDFRGFVFNSFEPGIRFFGNADNNHWQYNLAYFRRLDKDTNSGLNTLFEDRHENVVVANLYRQDFPVMGHTLQGSVHYRDDRAGDEPDHYDNNGFLIRPASIGDERPKNIQSTYLGFTGDGHFGRINTSEAFYYVFGDESHNPIAGREVDIKAWMAAAEISYDLNWLRFRASLFWASGDKDPFDGDAEGFDAIFDNPQFVGGDVSFWQRQGIPFIAGGIVNIVNRNSLLANLRAGKEEGQSNFVNPGIRIYNLGVDVEITPKLKLVNNASFLQFDEVESLRALRQDGSISRNIGYDLSAGLFYRPFLNNHMQFRLGGAAFVPDDGFGNLFGTEMRYQVFSNLILEY